MNSSYQEDKSAHTTMIGAAVFFSSIVSTGVTTGIIDLITDWGFFKLILYIILGAIGTCAQVYLMISLTRKSIQDYGYAKNKFLFSAVALSLFCIPCSIAYWFSLHSGYANIAFIHSAALLIIALISYQPYAKGTGSKRKSHYA